MWVYSTHVWNIKNVEILFVSLLFDILNPFVYNTYICKILTAKHFDDKLMSFGPMKKSDWRASVILLKTLSEMVNIFFFIIIYRSSGK